MPIDPSLSLKVQAPQYESPINMMSQIAQLRASQQQEAFNALRLAEAQRQQEDYARYNALMQRGGATPQELIQTAPGRAAFKSIGEAYQLQQAGEKERRLAEASRFELQQKQASAVMDALRSLAPLPDDQLTPENVSTRLRTSLAGHVPQQAIDAAIGSIPPNATPADIRREINVALRHSMTGQQQAEYQKPTLKEIEMPDGRTMLVDVNQASPGYQNPSMVFPSKPRVVGAGSTMLQGTTPVYTAPATTRAEPAPSVTTVVDPKDASRMLTIDARAYRGGSLGEPGVLGVAGKSSDAAKAAAKTEEKQAKTEAAQQQLINVLDDLKTNYKSLDEARAIPSIERNVRSNILSATAATGPGQVVGRFFGTKEQVYRDAISSSRNMLLNAIKNATGMSAQQLNSNVEFKSWMNALTDPGQSYQAVEKIIGQLEKFVETAQTTGKMPRPGATGDFGAAPRPTRGQTPVESASDWSVVR